MNPFSELPFYELDREDLLKLIGTWVYTSSDSLLQSKDLFQDVIVNPESSDHFQEQVQNCSMESKYFSIKRTGNIFQKNKTRDGFSIFHLNMRSLNKNLNLLEDLLSTFKTVPEIIAISETKLKDDNIYNININGYSFLNTNSMSCAGGVGLYISNELKFIRRQDLDTQNELMESLWIEIVRQKQKNIVIGCIYRHPNYDTTQFYEIVKNQLSDLNDKRKEVFITGDININFMNYNTDNNTSDYLDMLLSTGFIPLITKSTRITQHTSTLIDHIYTNIPQNVLNTGICLADITDHLPIFCTVNSKLSKINKHKLIRDFSNFDEISYIEEIKATDLKCLIDTNVNESMSRIINTIQAIFEKHAPLKRMSNKNVRQYKKPWITKAILVSIKKKQKLFRSHALSKDPEKVKFYKQYNNKLNRIKEESKKMYYKRQFNLNSQNLKVTWKLIGTLFNRNKKSQTEISKLIYQNKCYIDKKDIAQRLNEHFTNVGERLAEKLPITNIDPSSYIKKTFRNSFMFRAITPEEVQDIIMNLKGNKSTLGVPQKFIKIAHNFISEPLAIIFNLSLLQGIVPDELKIAKITPIDKGGNSLTPENYRPISTLSTFTQIFEKLIQKQLTCYIDKHDILFDYQFGFRRGHSTAQAIVEITDNLKKAIDNNLYTCGVFLDFSKAFDTVNHQILIHKLEKYGIRGVPLLWFKNYLQNRKQFVALGNIESDQQTITCGIPQGSVLGPLLFLIYINDLPQSTNLLQFKIFADDTNLFASAKNLTSLADIVNQELVKVKVWCDTNKLSINTSKTNYMIVKSARKRDGQINIKIPTDYNSEISIERKNCIKYLGVMIDDSISWKQHISFVCSRISRNTGIIAKLRHFLSVNQLKQIYYNLIYPYLSYAIMAWGSAYTSHITKIQSKQNHIIRLIFFATTYGKDTASAKPLLNLLDVLTVKNVYYLHVLKFMHL